MAFFAADRIKVSTTTTGTNDFGIGSATTSAFHDFDDAGVPNGATVHYSAYTATEFECGEGIYSSAGPTLSRDTIFASSNGGLIVNFGSSPTVIVTPLAETVVLKYAPVLGADLDADSFGLLNVGSIDAATESTIETAIDTLANLTSVQGRTVTLADAGADVVFAWDDSASAYKNMALADITTEAAPASGDFVLIYTAEGALAKSDFAVLPDASDTFAGVIEVAIQSEMETGSSTTLAVTPGRQHFHPSAAKGWCRFTSAGTVAGQYNASTVTDNGTGSWTVNWDTDFSSADYAAIAYGGYATGTFVVYQILGHTAAGHNIQAFNSATAAVDPDQVNQIMIAAFGDQ